MPKRRIHLKKKRGVFSILSTSSKPPSYNKQEIKDIAERGRARLLAWAEKEGLEIEEVTDSLNQGGAGRDLYFNVADGAIKIDFKFGTKSINFNLSYDQSAEKYVEELEIFIEDFADKLNLKYGSY